MTCIYRIRNTETGDCYIGSCKTFKERKRRHLKDLRGQRHHSPILQRAFDKYGQELFEFEVIEEVEESNLVEREQHYLDTESPTYNISPTAYSSLGRVVTEETRAKQRKYALENNVLPPESTWRDRQKAVVMLDKNTGKELEEFESLAAACRACGKDHTWVSMITSVCKGKRKTAMGYKWRFV